MRWEFQQFYTGEFSPACENSCITSFVAPEEFEHIWDNNRGDVIWGYRHIQSDFLKV